MERTEVSRYPVSALPAGSRTTDRLYSKENLPEGLLLKTARTVACASPVSVRLAPIRVLCASTLLFRCLSFLRWPPRDTGALGER